MRFWAVALGGVVALALGWLMVGLFNRVAPVGGGAPELNLVWVLSGLALVALVALLPFVAGGMVAGRLSPGRTPGLIGAASAALCALLVLVLGVAYLAFALEAFGPALDVRKGDPSSFVSRGENLGVAFGQASIGAVLLPFVLFGGWVGGRLGGSLRGG